MLYLVFWGRCLAGAYDMALDAYILRSGSASSPSCLLEGTLWEAVGEDSSDRVPGTLAGDVD